MTRISLKVTGAQGQGVNSVGEICGKGLKRSGYCVFGYREYMSLIKGGHSSYQLDIDNQYLESTETTVDILVNFNHHGLEDNLREVKPGGIILHQTPQWTFSQEDQKWLEENNVTVVYLPAEDILKKMKFPSIMGNVLVTSAVWTLLGQSDEVLKELVRAQFSHKGEEVIEKNFQCIQEGTNFINEYEGVEPLTLPEPNADFTDHLYLTGSEAMGLGVIHSGCRLYAGYPMTPSSPLLKYIADTQNESGMVIKQAEDEITAAQIMTGAMHMGTRAATATSGGGFDLMTETVSLNGIIENPSVFFLSQRPGPATGLPTWSAQGDLLLALGSSHGEFARLVMSVSNAQDGFDLMPEVFNYADEYQTPVICLYDKQIAEGLYTQAPYDQSKAEIRRGNLVTDSKGLAKLKPTDRYDPSVKDGITPRWLPGSEAQTYCAQGDEHDSAGVVNEGAQNAVEQMEKRMRKVEALKEVLPEPELFLDGESGPGPGSGPDMDVLLVGWGSTKGPVLDALRELRTQKSELRIGYLHYTYMWPLKTEFFEGLHSKAKKTVLIEGNFQGQLGMLLKMECGLEFDERILKYDGRPFFVDELIQNISLVADDS